MFKDFFLEDIQLRQDFETPSNKYDYGKVLIIGGNDLYGGAVLLAIEAALKSGSGIVYVHTKNKYIPEILTKYPSVICLSELSQINKYDDLTVVAGPGTDESFADDKIINFLSLDFKNVILDAGFIGLVKKVNFSKPPIITPHSGEASKLIDITAQEINTNRQKTAQIISERFNCITVLKGPNTLISYGTTYLRSKNGNNILATAGTGDILAGLIGSLCAQGSNQLESIKLAVAVHGKCAEEFGKRGILGTELIDLIRIKLSQL